MEKINTLINFYIIVYIYISPNLDHVSASVQSSWREIQGDSVARGPKLLSIKNYVIEIMT